MSTIIFNWIWHWFVSWAGLSVLVALAAGAAWWLLPPIFVKAKALAFNIMLGALAFNFVYTMGYQNGASITKAEWDKREQAAIDRGRDIRDQAEAEIEPVVEEPVVPASGSTAPVPAPRRPVPAPPRWMSDDRYNRDNH